MNNFLGSPYFRKPYPQGPSKLDMYLGCCNFHDESQSLVLVVASWAACFEVSKATNKPYDSGHLAVKTIVVVNVNVSLQY